MREILLDTQSCKSVIRCGKGAFEKFAPELAGRRVFIVTDSNVFAYYRYDMWRIFGDSPIKILPAGENSKSVRYLTSIIQEMLDYNMRRTCTVIAIGGGVVGDIAGLAASLYMRGVHLVQIPTTLLSQVDSSVGGKTAVDFGGVKNLLGSFYQPEEVIVDPVFLNTLTEREYRCGLGEIVKYGALNVEIFDKLKDNIDNLMSADFLEDIAYDCIRHKADVVSKDEHDLNGIRKSLNLGHTTGHALELYHRKKSHGEYVLIGMYYELYIAEKLNTCPKNYADGLRELILAVIKKIPRFDDITKAAELARHDKKNRDAKISLVLPAGRGKWEEVNLDFDAYAELLEECSEALGAKK